MDRNIPWFIYPWIVMSDRIVSHAWGGGSMKRVKNNTYSCKKDPKDQKYKMKNLFIWFDMFSRESWLRAMIMHRQTIIYKVWSIVFGEMVSCHAFIIHLVCQVWDRNVKRPVIFFRRFVKGLFW